MKRNITVAIRTLNNQDVIVACFEALVKQVLPPSEVLVVDNGSQDDTVRIAQSFSSRLPIKVVNNSIRGFASGMNMGLIEAANSYVAFLSSDCYPDPHWLDELVKAMQRNDAAVVQGFERLDINSNFISEVIMDEKTKSKEDQVIQYFNNTNTLFNRDIVKQCLPFTSALGGEDTLMSISLRRIKARFILTPKAFVWHDKFPNQAEFARITKRHARACRSLFKKEPLKPRMYLNGYYWGIREVIIGVYRRDMRYIKVGCLRSAYTISGMLGL